MRAPARTSIPQVACRPRPQRIQNRCANHVDVVVREHGLDVAAEAFERGVLFERPASGERCHSFSSATVTLARDTPEALLEGASVRPRFPADARVAFLTGVLVALEVAQARPLDASELDLMRSTGTLVRREGIVLPSAS